MTGEDDGYAADMRAFRAKRDAALRADDGWLCACGLSVLSEGRNQLPFGEVTVRGDTVLFQARPELAMTRRGEPVREGRLRPDQDDDVLSLGSVTYQLIRRGDTLAIRARDTDSPVRRAFRGSEWFPIDPTWRVEARIVPLERPRDLEIAYSISASETSTTEYVLVFERRGVTYSLDPVVEPKRLFILFRDLTNGVATTDIGRYLYAPLPHLGRTVLDFNQALSPGCAFSEHVLCPVPPLRNALRVHVDAGERAPSLRTDS